MFTRSFISPSGIFELRMNVMPDLEARADEPIPVAVVGPGVFGAHLVYQIEETPSMVPTVLADLDTEKAKRAFRNAGVDSDSIVSTNDPERIAEAVDAGKRVVTEDGVLASEAPVEVVIETTGDPEAAARHAWAAISAGRDIVMVSVEVDATVGPLLSQYASRQGVTYSMAYGDEPSQVVGMVDWAQANGFEVVAAGQGTELNFDRHGTHEDSLERYGVTESFIEDNDPDPKMYNTFLDGTKVAVELCAAANAIGMRPDVGGTHMPETDREGLLETLRPKADGGILEQTGVIDSVTPTDYRNPSAFVITRADNEATQRYLDQRYNILTANNGKYQLFDRQYHLPPETLVSVASVALHDRPTGTVREQTSEVVAKAKRDLEPGETLATGEDTIYGVLEAADVAANAGWVPLELLNGAELQRPVATDEPITEDDVELETDSVLYHLRKLQDELV
jgi:predicted homoserine dehydrogenase-like protein